MFKAILGENDQKNRHPRGFQPRLRQSGLIPAHLGLGRCSRFDDHLQNLMHVNKTGAEDLPRE